MLHERLQRLHNLISLTSKLENTVRWAILTVMKQDFDIVMLDIALISSFFFFFFKTVERGYPRDICDLHNS